MIRLSDEVGAALSRDGPVVALETSVLAQGLPPPRSLEAARAVSAAIRSGGAVPGWIALIEGEVRVGLSDDEVRGLAEPGRAVKVARRDIAPALAGSAMGATTVSAMLWAARRAGIAVAATGGIGGVHRGGRDVSADLAELARTPALLVCSGPKSIVDAAATLERLEELGVAVVGYRTARLPAFVVGEHPDLPLEHRVDSPEEAAALAAAGAGIDAAILLCNPVPERQGLPHDVVETAVVRCEAQADREGISGKARTPFLLACLAEETDGASLEANLALLESNATLAAEVAVALARAS
jgi:pseudouridine-5'-phosphate glycosidase